ncbi:uncharacterized protein LOC105692174 [Athalia rosae]|uniref:uncharacterized protein LOC105692174 n=1 Tax=Athalia rosae TaxID=37344 RepID=UPI0020339AC4|nr:uncharacterized protein LOC105692174 [Athalia rosae]
MASGGVFSGKTPLGTTVIAAFFISSLLQSTLLWKETSAAPARQNDILAGTEFLSVFINGAMAQPPIRRRGSRRGSQPPVDHVASESQHQEASIYRISRTSKTANAKPKGPAVATRDEGVRFYPISQKSFENSAGASSTVDDVSTTVGEIGSVLTTRSEPPPPASGRSREPINQKVIGISVTSTVEATPYKVRVEHYDGDEMTTASKRPATLPVSSTTSTTSTTPATSTSVTFVTPLPALLVTEELSNIVSESNRSEFTVDEGSPRTSWKHRGRTTLRPMNSWHVSHPLIHRHHRKEMSDSVEVTETETAEKSHEIPEVNSEVSETHVEPTEPAEHLHQGRKAGRHYETILYTQPGSRGFGQSGKGYGNQARIYGEPAKVYGEPEKVYSEPAKVYSEPARMYGEPAKVYSEPSKVYGEPAEVYGEPEKIYSEPSKVYGEPAKIYGEPSKVYSEPAKIYSEPAKIYGADGRPVKIQKSVAPEEPQEENYEVDEAVSVSSNGNVHGPQTITESPDTHHDSDDRHRVYVEEGRNFRKYRVEERTPDGFIVGEYGVVSHDDGLLRGVRYTADGNINPRLIHDTLMKFLAL